MKGNCFHGFVLMAMALLLYGVNLIYSDPSIQWVTQLGFRYNLTSHFEAVDPFLLNCALLLFAAGGIYFIIGACQFVHHLFIRK